MKKKQEKLKLVPRNAPAFRLAQEANPQPRLVTGNSVSTRLESGIGNCFPGLECDLRNLERRFFPFLVMDMPNASINLEKVEIESAKAAHGRGELSAEAFEKYQTLHQSLGKGITWSVRHMAGHFGPLGALSFAISDLGTPSTGVGRLPADAWTAVRLIEEGSSVTIRLEPRRGSSIILVDKRARYLGDDGALAAMFVPGELTQSLCSPWTHDFRDCACFYWASNHPDIVLPPYPSAPTTDTKWDIPVPWERADRSPDQLPAPASSSDPRPIEFEYGDINLRWQSLNFVLERREQIGPYAQQQFSGAPLANEEVLLRHLRYAAGVELAVIHEYLAAAYSLKDPSTLSGELASTVAATHAEIMRIAIAEMRHLRAVNDVIANFIERPAFKPALGVATKLPGATPGTYIDVNIAPLTPERVIEFINIESPSQFVDGVYSPILATLIRDRKDDVIQPIRTIMGEGEDHYRTFLAIQEWLKPFKVEQYLRGATLKPPPARDSANIALQARYGELLDLLYAGYKAVLPEGASKLVDARSKMIEKDGVADAAKRVAEKGCLVGFDVPSDKRFAPVGPPV